MTSLGLTVQSYNFKVWITICFFYKYSYRIYHMYSDRQAWANSIDPDEMPQNMASHLGLHCLPLIQQFLDTTLGSELYWFKF